MAEMEWKPQKDSTVSLHQQITTYLKKKIIHGEWTIGMKLPSQRSLAKQFEVNRSTIVTALEELAADGLIETKVGSGTKVINNTWSLLASTPPPDWTSYVKSSIHRPNISIIQKLIKPKQIRILLDLVLASFLQSYYLKHGWKKSFTLRTI